MFPFAVHQPGVYWCSWKKKKEKSGWAKCAQLLLSFYQCGCKWPHWGERGGLGWHFSSSSAADPNTIQRSVCNCKNIQQSFTGEKRCPCFPSFSFLSEWDLLRAVFKLYQTWVCSLKKEIRKMQAAATQKGRQTWNKDSSEDEGFQNGRW